jgi:MoxR-like ATPase
VSRLRDSQLGDPRVKDIHNYIVKGNLWEAFDSGVQPVLLIDEIDKADIEFPNDLLRELDRMEFYVYETRETIRARHRPVIIITSNNEKELPDAFLRRCFFHYIRFPDEATMTQIVDVHFPNLKRDLLRELDRMEFYVYETRETVRAKHRPVIIITSNNEKELPDAFLRRCFFHYIRFPDEATMTRIVDVHFPNLKRDLLREALTTFFKIRETPGLKKKPTTSELLDWIKLLVSEDIPAESLRSDDAKKLIPPLYGALLKNEQDVHLFEQLLFLSRRNAR